MRADLAARGAPLVELNRAFAGDERLTLVNEGL